MENFTEVQWENWAESLAINDWLVIDNFLSRSNLTKLQDYLFSKLEEEEFRKAGIGALGDFTIEKEIRGDWIYWLNKNRDTEIASFFQLIEESIKYLNRLCFLGMADSEFHLAHYPKGTHYEKHVDQFNERSNRLISMVFYLNPNWKPEHQGHLRIYNDESFVDIEPIAGRLVIFKSEGVLHEVTYTNVSRYSLTGWLLRKPPGLGYLR